MGGFVNAWSHLEVTVVPHRFGWMLQCMRINWRAAGSHIQYRGSEKSAHWQFLSTLKHPEKLAPSAGWGYRGPASCGKPHGFLLASSSACAILHSGCQANWCLEQWPCFVEGIKKRMEKKAADLGVCLRRKSQWLYIIHLSLTGKGCPASVGWEPLNERLQL